MTFNRLLSPLLLLCALLMTAVGSSPAHASGADLLSSLGIEANAKPKFLQVDEAFQIESEQRGDQLLLTLHIADDYYLYRHSLRFKGNNLTFSEPTLPEGTEHEDDFFGKTRVYYQQVSIVVPLKEVGGCHPAGALSGLYRRPLLSADRQADRCGPAGHGNHSVHC